MPRKSDRRPWYPLYNHVQFPAILLITFLMIRYSFGYSTHPGVHVFLSTMLIDVLLLRMWRRWNWINLGSAVILNGFGAFVVLHGTDALELKVAGWYVLCALLVVLTNWEPQRRDGRRRRGSTSHE